MDGTQIIWSLSAIMVGFLSSIASCVNNSRFACLPFFSVDYSSTMKMCEDGVALDSVPWLAEYVRHKIMVLCLYRRLCSTLSISMLSFVRGHNPTSIFTV